MIYDHWLGHEEDMGPLPQTSNRKILWNGRTAYGHINQESVLKVRYCLELCENTVDVLH
jgi:hypothetical protein